MSLHMQIVAAIMAITGIVMMAYADGFHGDSFVGVALAVGSASTSALYKVRPPSLFLSELWLSCVCMVSTSTLLPRHPGALQDVPRQRQSWRSGSFSFHHGLFQPHLHLLCAPHSVFHQGRALGIPVLTALGIYVWTGRTVAGWEEHIWTWFHPNVHTNFAYECRICRQRAIFLVQEILRFPFVVSF